jgi:hypothetical protein
MNEQNVGERFNPWGVVQSTQKDPNGPVANAEGLAREVPVEAAPIHETPMSASVAAVAPMGETIVHEAPMAEVMPHEAPVGEPVAEESGASKSIPYSAPIGETATHEALIGTKAGSSAALLDPEESAHFRTRWNEIQGQFVDEPRSAVQQADALVSEVVERITQMFAHEHSSLEGQWNQGNDVSTEDLRKALQHYRSFFNRLVV